MQYNRIILPEKTTDGSHTLYIPELDEHYHSVKGALTESLHIYCGLGLNHFVETHCDKIYVNVFEVGFGTGLNALLTMEMAIEKQLQVHYTTVELYPLTWEQVSPLGYSESVGFQQIHQLPWGTEERVNEHFILHKLHKDVLTMEIPHEIDVVYFDAFAPEKQPELWCESLLQCIYDNMAEDGVLTTYCAKGAVRRMLQQVGFKVERLQGPPGGKREVLRALKVKQVLN